MTPLCVCICLYPFFEATPPGDAPGPPVKTGANVRRFRGCNNDDSKRTEGMYRQRTHKAWGHTAHRGWARLLHDRARYLIIHGPAHRGANGAAMPTDEGDQDGHFFYSHSRWGLLRCLGARSRFCCLDPIRRRPRTPG